MNNGPHFAGAEKKEADAGPKELHGQGAEGESLFLASKSEKILQIHQFDLSKKGARAIFFIVLQAIVSNVLQAQEFHDLSQTMDCFKNIATGLIADYFTDENYVKPNQAKFLSVIQEVYNENKPAPAKARTCHFFAASGLLTSTLFLCLGG